MKKLFVSVPMKGRTEGEIKARIQKMKKIAEIYEGEELELMDCYIEDKTAKDSIDVVWFFGESLKKLAQADVFIGICESYDWNGCYIERKTAERYGVKMHTIFAEDIINNYDKYVEEASGKITASSLELKPCSCSIESYL